MTSAIECREIVKHFGQSRVIDRLNWSIPAGQLAALLGASGAGKTTLLRIMAGLLHCTSGQVEFDVPRPRVGLVFQNLALWPHLTVRQHLQCVLSHRPRDQRRRCAQRWLEEVRLPPSTHDQLPAQLSGGEAQRLALARALAAEPQILLLDEPLAQLDAALKGELLALVKNLAHAHSLTLVYVTHAWTEAASLCGQAGVMADGRIVQFAAPDEVFWRPANRCVAQIAGPLVELPLAWLDDRSILFHGGAPASLSITPIEGRRIALRPQQVRLTEPAGASRWRVLECRPQGAGWITVLSCDGRRLEAPAAALSESDEVGVEVLEIAKAASLGPRRASIR